MLCSEARFRLEDVVVTGERASCSQVGEKLASGNFETSALGFVHRGLILDPDLLALESSAVESFAGL